jgi:prolyl-tRNA synthetase
VRWELRTKLFLRTSEFYWQEGHTAHATQDEAQFETEQMLDVYADFARNEAAIPVIAGEKSPMERFAGADQTLTIEAMMGDRRALQSGTSHNLGQNFAKAFDIKYLDENNVFQYCWTTSWGLSTRFVGAIIMVHGDDQGLILPPRLAPYQVVIVPIYKNEEEKSLVMEAIDGSRKELSGGDVRVKVDDREHLTPGFKFNDWELRGVPLRIEVGPRDVADNAAVLARRDRPGKADKQTVSRDGLLPAVKDVLDDIHHALFDRAQKERDENTFEPADYVEFKEAVSKGFARVWWAGNDDDEERIQKETKATLRCLPMERPDVEGVCFYTGKRAGRIAIFGRAY